MSLVGHNLPPASYGRLLDIIRSAGPLSRVEIAQRAELTQASVSIIVRTLLNDGLIREAGKAQSTGGKRRILLEVVPNARYAVGIHLSDDSIVFVVTNMVGGMIGRCRRPGPGNMHPSLVTGRIVDEIDQLLKSLGIRRDAVVGIGIVAAGPLDYAGGIIVGSPAMRHWDTFPLRDELSSRTGLPVAVDNDATAAAIGEFWGGRVDAPLSFACLYMGIGIGSGIVMNGVPFRGSASNAGEIGHVSLDVFGESCYCGNRGCLEMYAGPAAVIKQARQMGSAPQDIKVTDTTKAFDHVARLAVNSDQVALKCIRQSADYIADGAITLANMTDLDLIVLGGSGFAIAGVIYIEAIRPALAERSFARRAHATQVRLSSNPRDAAALGASALVLQQALAPRP
jgi:predicted NBD/HSP70 family sugar kinase